MERLQKYRFVTQIIFFLLGFTAFYSTFGWIKFLYVVLAVIAGAFYCGWVCPFGMIQDVFGRIGSKIFKNKLRMPAVIQRYLIYLRYLLMGFFLILAANQIWNFSAFDSRIVFFRLTALKAVETSAIVIMFLFIMAGMVFDRPFCNYFCPEGARYGLLSLVRIFSIRRNADSCISCNKCDRVCPMQIKISDKKSIRSPHCINCFQCISNCPVKGTLRLEKIKWPRKVASSNSIK